jgi:mono/diheme cytochrome c family protein
MKRGSILIAVGLAILGLGLAISFTHDGFSSLAKPTKLETVVARNVRRLAIPSTARSLQNPLLPSPEDLRDARQHFADHCAICHANDGSGDTLMGNGLYPKPPDLRQPRTQDLTDGELFWIIENGVRFTGMPAFPSQENHATAGGNHNAATENWKLVHFIRHLSHLTAAERIEMENYNPKGPEERLEEEQENNFLNGASPKAPPESQKRRSE